MVLRYGLDSTGLGEDPVTRSCIHSNEHSGTTNGT